MVALRAGGADLDGDGVPDTDDAEPTMNTRKEVKEWRKWAKAKAKAYADTVHPRLQQKDGPPKKMPLRRSLSMTSKMVIAPMRWHSSVSGPHVSFGK